MDDAADGETVTRIKHPLIRRFGHLRRLRRGHKFVEKQMVPQAPLPWGEGDRAALLATPSNHGPNPPPQNKIPGTWPGICVKSAWDLEEAQGRLVSAPINWC